MTIHGMANYANVCWKKGPIRPHTPYPLPHPPSFLCSIAYIVFPAEQLFPGPIFPFCIRKEFQRLWLVRIQTSREGYLLIPGLWGGDYCLYTQVYMENWFPCSKALLLKSPCDSIYTHCAPQGGRGLFLHSALHLSCKLPKVQSHEILHYILLNSSLNLYWYFVYRLLWFYI
jgi:hypothetical protein